MPSSEDIASAFSSLSHATRVDLLKALLRHLPEGLTAGQLGEATCVAPSTLAFHLREMERGGVVQRRPDGRRTIVRVDISRLTSIASTLTRFCCAGADGGALEAPEQGDWT